MNEQNKLLFSFIYSILNIYLDLNVYIQYFKLKNFNWNANSVASEHTNTRKFSYVRIYLVKKKQFENFMWVQKVFQLPKCQAIFVDRLCF